MVSECRSSGWWTLTHLKAFASRDQWNGLTGKSGLLITERQLNWIRRTAVYKHPYLCPGRRSTEYFQLIYLQGGGTWRQIRTGARQVWFVFHTKAQRNTRKSMLLSARWSTPFMNCQSIASLGPLVRNTLETESEWSEFRTRSCKLQLISNLTLKMTVQETRQSEEVKAHISTQGEAAAYTIQEVAHKIHTH